MNVYTIESAMHKKGWRWNIGVWVRVASLTGLLVLLTFHPIMAHTPHDNIDDLVLSPNYDEDKTVFLINNDQLLNSTDGGYFWKQLVRGLNNKHLLSSIAISPGFQADGTVFVSSFGDGIYKSVDRGQSWSKLKSGSSPVSIERLCISPGYLGDRTVFASGVFGELFITKDAGLNWERINYTGENKSAISCLIMPRAGHLLLADKNGSLYRSLDYGHTWALLAQMKNDGYITSVAFLPSDRNHQSFLVATEKGGILKTVDEGAFFTAINEGLSDIFITDISLSPDYSEDKTIFACGWNEAVFKSSNDGKTWSKYASGIDWNKQAESKDYWSPHYRVIECSNDFQNDKTLFLSAFEGLHISNDAGHSWRQIETLPIRLIKGFDISSEHNVDPVIAASCYGGGAYITHDKGLSWTVSNVGLNRMRLSDIAFSPSYRFDRTIFSGSRGSLLKSTDNSGRWQKIPIKYKSWRRYFMYVLHLLRVPSSVYNAFRKHIMTSLEDAGVFPTVIELSPNFDSDHTLFFGTRIHGIYKSTDGGKTVVNLWGKQFQTSVTSLAVSPKFFSDKTVFAAIRGKGIFKTENGGKSWKHVNDGLTITEHWKKDPLESGTIKRQDVYLDVSPAYHADSTVFAATAYGLFKSTDGGEHWEKRLIGKQTKDPSVIAVAISPDYAKDRTVIISIKGKGLYKSQDRGLTFTEISTHTIVSEHQIEFIEFSKLYSHNKTICIASEEEIFCTIDNAKSWQVVKRPARYENIRRSHDSDQLIRYGGEWDVVNGDGFSNGCVSISSKAGDSALLHFVGTGVSWIGITSDDFGIADVYIDGEFMKAIDQFSEQPGYLMEMVSIDNLVFGSHSIRIEVSDKKNLHSKGRKTAIDAFDVRQ